MALRCEKDKKNIVEIYTTIEKFTKSGSKGKLGTKRGPYLVEHENGALKNFLPFFEWTNECSLELTKFVNAIPHQTKKHF